MSAPRTASSFAHWAGPTLSAYKPRSGACPFKKYEIRFQSIDPSSRPSPGSAQGVDSERGALGRFDAAGPGRALRGATNQLHELASLKRCNVRAGQIEALSVHPRCVEAAMPIRFNAGWIVCPDRVDQCAALGADFRAAGRWAALFPTRTCSASTALATGSSSSRHGRSLSPARPGRKTMYWPPWS